MYSVWQRTCSRIVLLTLSLACVLRGIAKGCVSCMHAGADPGRVARQQRIHMRIQPRSSRPPRRPTDRPHTHTHLTPPHATPLATLPSHPQPIHPRASSMHPSPPPAIRTHRVALWWPPRPECARHDLPRAGHGRSSSCNRCGYHFTADGFAGGRASVVFCALACARCGAARVAHGTGDCVLPCRRCGYGG